MLSSILHIKFNQISEYVSNNKNLLQQIQLHSSTSNQNYHQNLQTIIILTYKIKFIELIQSLWITYRKSGIDDLQIIPEIQNINRKIWPQEFLHLADKSYTLLFPTIIPDESRPSITIQKLRKYQFYLSFIDSCLSTLQKKHETFHTSLTNEIQYLPDYSQQQLQKQINFSIQHDLLPIQIQINCHIELVHHNYKDEIYRRQYLDQIYNQEQVYLLSSFSLFISFSSFVFFYSNIDYFN